LYFGGFLVHRHGTPPIEAAACFKYSHNKHSAKTDVPMSQTIARNWAKIEFDAGHNIVRWHSLYDHSADVAAVMLALLNQSTIERRLAHCVGRVGLSPANKARLAALAFLHDIGKANRGFQNRQHKGASPVGHIEPLAWLLNGSSSNYERLDTALGLRRIDAWFSGSTYESCFDIMLAHHGRPASEHPQNAIAHWSVGSDGDPVATLAEMRPALDNWFADAFSSEPPMLGNAYFDHAFAGLLMLADWIGSDTYFFPMANGMSPDRWSFACRQATAALRQIGIDVVASRSRACRRSVDFPSLFGVPAPREIQSAATLPAANCVVLEAETGSGKTEAALWRFVELFRRGEVDGLYFALPTRVAASQMFTRVKRLRDKLFPEDDRPPVVLAVPGQVMADDAQGRALPDFGFAWDDANGARRKPQRWAAEHPKRFLAAQIAVGTIDQALLGSILTKHAHMRGAALLRHLLVVDEVHASDRFQERLLTNLLDGHLQAGGHALMLSATLGADAKSRLLRIPRSGLEAAVSLDYPSLTWAEGGTARTLSVKAEGRGKSINIKAVPLIDDAVAIASLASEAAASGAKILVLRNTVAGAVAVQKALEASGHDAVLLRVAGIPAMHHGRFGSGDRRLLDAAVEELFGKESKPGAAIVVGTQTLEVSLDLDADLLITDLCPVDVLLQRIGRLHRHGFRVRPDGFAHPQVVVPTPQDRDLWPALRRGGNGFGNVYPDPRIIEATWRLIERHAVWTIPAMNRLLVEHATHGDALMSIGAELRARSAEWNRRIGEAEADPLARAQQASYALLDRSRSFSDLRMPTDERLATRLGDSDRLLDFSNELGPFGTPIGLLRVPHFLAPDAGEAEPEIVGHTADGIAIRLGTATLIYGRLGLARQRPV
jgi:CRISPR-associated endonuclease/helicase Cas3